MRIVLALFVIHRLRHVRLHADLYRAGTYLHLRIFEMAKDAIFEAGKYEILAG